MNETTPMTPGRFFSADGVPVRAWHWPTDGWGNALPPLTVLRQPTLDAGTQAAIDGEVQT